MNIDFHHLFDSSLDCIFILDLHGNLVEANPATLSLLGYADGEERSLNLKSVMDGDEWSKAANAINFMAATGRQGAMTEFKVKHKDGGEIFVEAKASIISQDSRQVILGICRDVTPQRKLNALVKKQEKELAETSLHYQETNTALKVMMNHWERERTELEDKITENVKILIAPLISKLKRTSLSEDQKIYVTEIEQGLNQIVSPFVKNLKLSYAKLTPMEIRIANMIKEGKKTKDISVAVNISKKTVEYHRYNIRSKLSLLNKKINLRTYLLTAP